MMVVSLQGKQIMVKKNFPTSTSLNLPLSDVSLYLCAAAVAATSIANCLMVLSSRYFCSHLVMSASRARIRSSFSLNCCCNVEELNSAAVWSAAWF